MAENTTPAPKGQSGSLQNIFGSSSPFKALQDEMDRIFHAFSSPQMSWSTGSSSANGALGLRVDIAETDDRIQVKADLPGVAEEDVEVTLEDDILRLRAEKKTEDGKDGQNWRVIERSYGVFERSIRMPAGIDPESVAAEFTKGVLTVTLPKPPEAKATAKRIEVKAAA